MGIKNINTLLKNYSKNHMEVKKLQTYQGQIIVIDTSIFLYKYLYNKQDYLVSFTKQILRLLINNIKPIYIFDGVPPKEKNIVLKNRLKRKKNLEEKKEIIKNLINNKKNNININNEIINENNDENHNEFKIKLENKSINKLEEELNTFSKRIIRVKDEHILNCKKLFDLFNIKYIDAIGEAEVLCAKLLKKKVAVGCLTEDTDLLANGGNIFIRNFNFNKNDIQEYSLKKILEDLDINYKQFVDLCILCGCDYTAKIKGIGPINALKLIKKYKNIESLIENIDVNKYKIPPTFNYLKARNLFFDNHVDEEIIKEINIYFKNKISYNENDINRIFNFVKENSNLKNNQILIKINNVLKP